MTDRDGFLQRWSRLKTETREARNQPTERPTLPEMSNKTLPATGDGEPGRPEDGMSDADLLAEHRLPDIESLTADSDFTVFMQAGVPQRLRNLALRKLWQSDPVFAELDGLLDYNDDYSQVVPIGGEILNYRPGIGYVDEEAVADTVDALEEGAVAGEEAVVAESAVPDGGTDPAAPEAGAASGGSGSDEQRAPKRST